MFLNVLNIVLMICESLLNIWPDASMISTNISIVLVIANAQSSFRPLNNLASGNMRPQMSFRVHPAATSFCDTSAPAIRSAIDEHYVGFTHSHTHLD